MKTAMNTYYGIDSGDGNELTTGLSPEHYARQVAQRMANERGESVYLYAVPSDGDAEEITPEATDVDPIAKEDILTTARARFFASRGVETLRVLVEPDGAVLVWNDLESHYTRTHSLSARAERRIARAARNAVRIDR